jgi:hypothetical protein
MITVALGCSCSAVAGQNAPSGPSIICATAAAFAVPLATSTTALASRIVPIPWVTQCSGTWDTSPPKNRELSWRVWGERVLTAGPAGEGRRRLVEADVSVAADAQQLHVHPAAGTDDLLVLPAGRLEVLRGAVGNPHGARRQPEPLDDLPVDHRAVALRMSSRQAHVLVQREPPHPVQGQPLPGMPGEGRIGAGRAGPGGEAEDGVGLPGDDVREDAGRVPADRGGVGLDADPHRALSIFLVVALSAGRPLRTGKDTVRRRG